MVLDEHGTVLTFGHGAHGGNGLLVPTPLPALVARAISACDQHNLVLSRDGSVFAFGLNYHGRLGLGDQENRLTPTRIPGCPL